MLDISRDKVPTMKTLFELVDLMASLKLNEFQLYTEHTFAFQRHLAECPDGCDTRWGFYSAAKIK